MFPRSDSPDWAVCSPVTTPTAMCPLPTALSMKPWLATFIFWSYSLWIYIYVYLFVCFRWTVGLNGSHWWTISAYQNTAPIAVWGWSRYISGQLFFALPYRETRACGSIDCTLDSDSKLRQRDVRNSSQEVFIWRWLFFEALGLILRFSVHAVL